jgi:putative oligomerization/nucleic acid binding protein
MIRRRGLGRAGRPGLLGTVGRTAVVAGTATAVSGGVMRHQQQRAQEQQEAAAPPPPAPPTDVVSQLKTLGDLKDRGLLTDAEFEAQKARLLAL